MAVSATNSINILNRYLIDINHNINTSSIILQIVSFLHSHWYITFIQPQVKRHHVQHQQELLHHQSRNGDGDDCKFFTAPFLPMEPGSPKSSPSPCIYDLALCLSRLLRCVKGLEMMNPFALRQHFPKLVGRWNLFTFSYPIVCCEDFNTQGSLFHVNLLKMQQISCYHLSLMKRRNG